MNNPSERLIDIGVNLMSSRLFKRRGELLSRSVEASVHGLILTGTDLESSKRLAEFCDLSHRNSPQLWSTAGIHPHDALSVEGHNMEWINELRTLRDTSPLLTTVCQLANERQT